LQFFDAHSDSELMSAQVRFVQAPEGETVQLREYMRQVRVSVMDAHVVPDGTVRFRCSIGRWTISRKAH
jgi:hypothetical protein